MKKIMVIFGTRQDNVIKYAEKLIHENVFYKKMSNVKNPYGDGKSSRRIVDYLKNLS